MEQQSYQENLGIVFESCAAEHSEREALSWLIKGDKGKKPTFNQYTYAETMQKIATLSHALCSISKVGDRVLLLGGNSPEWMIATLAVFFSGLVLVPPFPVMTADEIQHQLQHSEATIAIVENQAQLKKLGAFARTSLEHVITMLPTKPKEKVVEWKTFCAPFEKVESLPDRARKLDLDTECLQFYTESEYGFPVPVIHTHGSILANIRLMQDTGICEPKDRVIVVLYFAHIYPLLTGLFTVFTGAALVVPGAPSNSARRDVRAMIECLKHGRGTIAAIVPYFLQTARIEIEKQLMPSLVDRVQLIKIDSPRSWRIWETPVKLIGSYCRDMKKLLKEMGNWQGHVTFFRQFFLSEAIWSALARYRRELFTQNSDKPKDLEGLSEPLKDSELEGWKQSYATAIYLLTGSVRATALAAVWGYDMHTIVSGGSKLKHRNTELFEALGLAILEGYGSSPGGIVNVQRRGQMLPDPERKPETVGPPLGPEIEIRLAAGTNEILISSPTLFTRYEGYPELTARDLIDIGGKRFYRTADIGKILSSGDLRILNHLDTRYRMYNSLGGEKVFPSSIEAKIERSSLVQKAFVWGENVPFNVAIIFVDRQGLKNALQEQGKVILLSRLEKLMNSEGTASQLDARLKEFVSEQVNEFIRQEVNTIVPGPAKIRSLIIASRNMLDYPELLTLEAPEGTLNSDIGEEDAKICPSVDACWSLNYDMVLEVFKEQLKDVYGDMLI